MKAVPLSREKHANLRVRPLTDLRPLANHSRIALYAVEVPLVVHEYPVLIAARADGLGLVGLTGLAPHQNLMVTADGKWRASHLPAVLRRAPFLPGRVADKDDLILCIDEDSPLFSQAEGEPLFAADGSTTEAVTRASALLGELERHNRATTEIVATLRRLDLLIPWTPPARRNITDETRAGLFCVDEKRLLGLDGNTLAELQKIGGLALVYGHLYSLDRVNILERLTVAMTPAVPTDPQAPVDLDRMFGIVEDDPFQF